jgi:hypothetical protein
MSDISDMSCQEKVFTVRCDAHKESVSLQSSVRIIEL